MEGQATSRRVDADQWMKVRQILNIALEMPREQRAAYLAEACGGDMSLQREIDSLLSASEKTGWIDRPAITTGFAAQLSQQPDVSCEVRAGQVVAHYQLINKIGQGGMGTVFEAIDQSLGRTVALKVISGFSGTPQERDRFFREAKAASALNHSNIVTIYEYGADGPVDFIAMEYVRGSTLQQIVAGQRVPFTTLLQYARQAAAAVHKAHAAGIVHRDLNPRNIMVAEEGIVKVLDFGLAKWVPQAGTDVAEMHGLTRTGMMVGTPAYMSPEQAKGEETDYRSDIFSFGIILYQIAYGVHPFQSSDVFTTLYNIVHKQPARIDNPVSATPKQLSVLIDKCLKKDRTERWQSMAEVAAGLTAVLKESEQHDTVLAHAEEAATPPKRSFRPRVYWAAAALAIVVALGLVPPVRRSIASHFVTPTAITDETKLLLRNEYDDYQDGRSYLDRYYRSGNLDRAANFFESAIKRNPNYAPAYAGMSEVYLRRNITKPDKQQLNLALDHARKAVALEPDLALCHTAFGNALLVSGNNNKAEEQFKSTVALDPANSLGYLGLAKVAAAARSEAAESLFQKAISLAHGDWVPMAEYGIWLYGNAHYEEAIKAWERCRQLVPDNPRLLSSLGAAYHMLNRDDDAASLFQQALSIEPTARGYTNLGTLRYFQGSFSDAVPAFEKAVELAATNYLYWGNLADAYRWAPGQRDKANAAYSRAVALVRLRIADAPDNSDLLGHLAGYLAKSGDQAGALAEAKQVESLAKQSSEGLYQSAITYEVCGQRADALRVLKAALSAGYPFNQIDREPELISLRADVRYQRLLTGVRLSVSRPNQ